MRNIIFFLTLCVVTTSFFTSCEKTVGEAIPPQFDSGPHIFTSQIQDTTLISKNNEKWWFDYINVDGRIYSTLLESYNDIIYYRKEPNPKADSKLGEIFKIENRWFILEKIDEKHINISLKENQEKKDRSLIFSCSVGNASRKITIIQKGK